METIVGTENLRQRLASLIKPVFHLEEAMLVSATYDGDLRLAVLKFYEPSSERIWLWQDNSGHKPYCYTKLGMEELGAIKARKDVIRIEETQKLDLLSDKKIGVRRIIATDPLAIGGGQNSVRDEIRAWEADIKYYENYVYDEGLRMGVYYRIDDGKISHLAKETPERVRRSVEEIIRKNQPEFVPYITEWAELLGQPLVELRRIALDIEVANEAGRIPDPEEAVRPIIAVSFFTEKEKLVYLLAKNEKEVRNTEKLPYDLVFFDREADLIRATFNKIMDYPVIVTFNGDDFDLRYLKHRAEQPEIGIREEESPIALERVAASLKHGIHIDLYQFFRNKSIQVYAFGNKYNELTLNGVAEALLGKSKIEFEGEIGDLPPLELANYCLNDSRLTYELTSMSSSVVMKLLLVISRIGKMPMNDVSRLGVSNWIRSMLFFEHRKMNALIPRQDELSEKGGASSLAAIKGKKYKGGFVIEPKPGVYFNVSVLDFASLYPSLIKVHNLSYETVNCPHEECRSNLVPDTSHWVCTKRKGITSLVIGSLRDLRVSHYKPLARDPSLSRDDRELYNIVSQGLKVFLNASYGVTGFETFALYCLPVAEATAALGRYAITKTIERCQALGVNVVYGDSVTGERCITLLDPSGLLKVLPVEEFFNLFGSAVRREDGKEEAYPENWKALSVDPKSGAVSFKAIKAVIRHRSSKRVYRIWEKWGCTRVTEDHSLLASENGNLVFAKPAELDGKHLVRADAIPLAGEILAVDVYEALKEHSYTTEYKGRNKVLRAKCDDRWVWFSWTNRKSPIKVRRFNLVGTPEFKALVELLGAYVAEGSASTPESTSSRFGASIACSDRAWLSQLRDDYLTLFEGAKPSIIASSPGTRHLAYRNLGGQLVEVEYEDATHKIQMMNELSAVFFKAFCGQKSHGKHFPDFIFNVPREYKLLFLENLVKGDGSKVFGPAYSDEYRKRNFRFETKSLRVASGLSVLLSQLGVKHTIRYRPSKATYRFTTSTRYNRRRSVPIVQEEEYDGFVYDLSVEDYHTFVDSCGNAVLKNTDSLFIENPTREQVLTVTRWAEQELGVELDLEKNYRYVAFSSRKKNYFGVLPDGTPDIKGLTGKKSQTPEFLKKTFYEALDILGKVQSSADFERARTGIRELLTTMISRLKNKAIPIEELAFKVMIGKPTGRYNDNTPQHVRAAQLLEKTGREIKAGDIISYVKTKNPPFVKPVTLAKAEEIDAEKYIEYAHSMFDQMLDALDFSFDEIMGATTLDLFWS